MLTVRRHADDGRAGRGRHRAGRCTTRSDPRARPSRATGSSRCRSGWRSCSAGCSRGAGTTSAPTPPTSAATCSTAATCAASASAGAAGQRPGPRPADRGRTDEDRRAEVSTVCAACHKPDGKGDRGQSIPPLDGSEWVVGRQGVGRAAVAHRALRPAPARSRCGGQTYNGVMPSQGSVMKDYEIAARPHVRPQQLGQQGRPGQRQAGDHGRRR